MEEFGVKNELGFLMGQRCYHFFSTLVVCLAITWPLVR